MAPLRQQLPDANTPIGPWLAEALEVLAQGGLVVLPTETVYGIVARADQPAALERLAQAKGTPQPRAWTWHVASASALPPSLLRAPVQRLAAHFWPGPLTLILPGVPYERRCAVTDDWIGIRCTAGEFSAALCEAAPFPLVMTSANAHGQPAATDNGKFEELHLAPTDLILEGGPTHHQEASTILRLGAGSFELLREGQHSMDSLKRTAGKRIAFACTGNTCRSPMAEGIARHKLAERLECSEDKIADHGFVVSSMGIYAGEGSPAAEHAIQTLKERAIDLSAHRSRQATADGVAELDAVYCLTNSHLAALQEMLPPSEHGRLHLLDPSGHNISDPIGGSIQVYQDCADQIAACIAERMDDWA
jgi:tRNA threonylcarbamoyl adenosine modification protein (Sua5/YciO/YrdC/YwlC family)